MAVVTARGFGLASSCVSRHRRDYSGNAPAKAAAQMATTLSKAERETNENCAEICAITRSIKRAQDGQAGDSEEWEVDGVPRNAGRRVGFR